jgi:hypothetical protein
MRKREHGKGTFEHNRGSREINELLLRINRLVRARKLLRENGGRAAELHAKTAEIDRLQWRLADVVRSRPPDHDAAA